MSDIANQQGLDFIVDRSVWSKTRFVEAALPSDLSPGQALFRVDRFALTANNISYAMAGDMLRYWDFFPAEEGWGRIPAMGFGEVIASTHDGVAVGTRCFGFFPMSKHLLIQPASATAASIIDGAPHREGLAPAYNQYQPVKSDPLYSATHEDELSLLRGMFMTSFLAEDFLSDSDLYGADSVVISSASSKTSIAYAFVVSQKGRAKAIGLTSARNLEFVKSLGYYDEVHTYDEIDQLSIDAAAVYADMAGSTKISRAVHERLGDQLKFSQRIGGTHWDAGGDDGDIPGPAREFFFAPGQIKKRLVDWGPEGFQERLGTSLKAFLDASGKWLRIERSYGRDALERVYRETLEGSASPDTGHILSVWESEADASGS
jgi:NADPH:quinone reductase-like Zn-dependent oxidoreductase